MTREEELDWLCRLRSEIYVYMPKKWLIPMNDALDMAIKALEQEPSGDLISRDELLKAIDTWDKFGYTETGCFVREPKGDYVPYIHYDDVIKCIKGMSPVTPQEPKTGHWIEHNAKSYECSECHNTKSLYASYKTDYCHDCGCKMESE